VDENPVRIVELVEELALDVVQLHGDETPETVARLTDSISAEAWKAIRPRSGVEFEREARRYVADVDALHLDGWSPYARGGTALRFPWTDLARHRERLSVPLRLAVAGGLRPENVAEVIALLDPEIVDGSSGVESAPGIKDPRSIQKFAHAVRGAGT